MIVYKGMKKINKVSFICFASEDKPNKTVNIPIDAVTAERFNSYLGKLGQPVVTGNVEVEESEDLTGE